ncbi:uncharacterized protein LOC117642385 [Thrips palmi]|uniref:Uncharacterized protein LOC117642385 n=1 Tax=Thrips palmi TaxID=161013 RepID=A0A6P8YIC4_THRPL|nr:uncharacterized protein LOC117642385 [Thrips palmi]
MEAQTEKAAPFEVPLDIAMQCFTDANDTEMLERYIAELERQQQQQGAGVSKPTSSEVIAPMRKKAGPRRAQQTRKAPRTAKRTATPAKPRPAKLAAPSKQHRQFCRLPNNLCHLLKLSACYSCLHSHVVSDSTSLGNI